MEVVKVADHIIDIGPDAGRDGGQVVFTGTPEQMLNINNNHTAQYLKLEMQ